ERGRHRLDLRLRNRGDQDQMVRLDDRGAGDLGLLHVRQGGHLLLVGDGVGGGRDGGRGEEGGQQAAEHGGGHREAPRGRAVAGGGAIITRRPARVREAARGSRTG